jgi:hypothetical protein
VGNSSTTNTHGPKLSRYRKPIQLDRVTVREKCIRNTLNPATAATRPVADSSHPIGFPGRFHASTAPTVAKQPMSTTATAPFSPFPALAASLAGSG